MPNLVCTGAKMMCSFGASPSVLNVVPEGEPVLSQDMQTANIMDNEPMVNIPTFGMCDSLSNPEVASATAAALGVLTPMPCVPVTVGPWEPGADTVLINNFPALDSTSKCMCSWGGEISIVEPGEETVEIP